MGDTSTERRVSEDEVVAAMKPVSTPMPKPRAAKPEAIIDSDRVPTASEIFAPQRPAMEGAAPDVLMTSIANTVDALYQEVLKPKRQEIHDALARSPTPEAPGWAEKIVEAIVESVATATLGKLGSLAVGLLEHHLESASDGAKDAVKALGKYGGAKAGAYAGERAVPDPEQGQSRQLDSPTTTGQSLLDEFFDRLERRSVANRIDARDMVAMIGATASKHVHDLATLGRTLHGLIEDPGFVSWYLHEVTMQWMNFRARVALGPREPGQATDVYGANTIGGVAEGGVKSTKAWRGSHEGFVDISVDVTGAFPLFESATVVGVPSGAKILRNMGLQADTHGTSYSLATLPVYRRIWLMAGESALATNPAFVLTPEGAIEANFDDPVLAGIGGGARMVGDDAALATYGPDGDLAHKPSAKQATRAHQAMAGAQRIVSVLQMVSPENLQ